MCSWVPNLGILQKDTKTISNKYFLTIFVVVKTSQYSLIFITWRITANNSFLVACPHFYFLTKLPSEFPWWIWLPSGIPVQPNWAPTVSNSFPDDQDGWKRFWGGSRYSDSPVSRIEAKVPHPCYTVVGLGSPLGFLWFHISGINAGPAKF